MSRKTTYTFNMTVNKRFKELIEEKHLKQIEVAIALDTTATNVCRWINCKNGIAEPFFSRICTYFNVSSSWLNGESKYRNEEDRKNAVYDEVTKRVKESLKEYNLIESLELINSCKFHWSDIDKYDLFIKGISKEAISVAEKLGIEIEYTSKANEVAQTTQKDIKKPKRQRRNRNG